ncbi:sigma-70 family RNA polymerase sigma factor [uncultured Microbulbifer sp.]|uniref:RNA polymerase sigma factor n=1 Tax=uncultured Microbulbifer sp. TaxID=348147 RepID=UPI00260E2160|nr:sigma-70 family RNA polymerase sigma factor [uncultured Microbulbifer sp.]
MKTQHSDFTNERIFLQLVKERSKLLIFIRKRVRNTQETEDVYQEAVTRLTKQINENERPDNPVSYLYRIVINIINDSLRRGDTFAMELLSDEITCQDPQPEERVSDQQRFAIFVKLLSKLPVVTRNIIVMRKLQGKSNIEIAEQTGISAKAVEKKLNRTLKKIERNMEDHF